MKKFKKLLSGATAILLAAALLFPSAASAADIRDFYDIRNHWSYESVRFCVDEGLFSGVSQHRFDPDGNLSRAMFVSVLARLALQFSYIDKDGLLSHPSAPSSSQGAAFPDVPSTAWYAASVAWAVDAGILSGYADGGFHPDAPISREQMAVITCSFFEKVMQNPLPTNGSISFRDQGSVSTWAREAVLTVGGAGLIVGNEKGQFLPREATTRGAAAVVLNRICNLCRTMRQDYSYVTGLGLSRVYTQSFTAMPSSLQIREGSGTVTIGRITYPTVWTAGALSCRDGTLRVTLSEQGNTLSQGGFSIRTEAGTGACYVFRCTVPTQAYGATFRCGIQIGSLSLVPFESHTWGDAAGISVYRNNDGTVLYERNIPGLRSLTDGQAHTYAVTVTQDACVFYIDGVFACRYTGDIPDTPATVFCEAAFGADEGILFPSLLPMVFSVDEITVYDIT